MDCHHNDISPAQQPHDVKILLNILGMRVLAKIFQKTKLLTDA